jgi:hypothetical protein
MNLSHSAGKSPAYILILLGTYVIFGAISIAILGAGLASTAQAKEDMDSEPDSALFAPAHSIGTLPLEAEGKFFVGGSRSSLGKDAVSASQWYYLSASASHKPSKITFGFNAGYSQALNTEHDEDTPDITNAFDSPIMTLSRSWKHGKDFDGYWIDAVSIGLAGTTPGNKDAYDKRFKGSVGPYVTVDQTLGHWSLSETLGYSHGVYGENSIVATGEVNSPDAMKTLTVLGYSFSDKLSLNGTYQLNYSRDFEADIHSRALWNLSLEYAINKTFDTDFGLGSAVGYLGPDAQADLLDSSGSGVQAYVELGIAI